MDPTKEQIELLEERLAVMKAFANEESIEFAFKDMPNWQPCKYPDWNWKSYCYRIAPPKPEVLYMVGSKVNTWGKYNTLAQAVIENKRHRNYKIYKCVEVIDGKE